MDYKTTLNLPNTPFPMKANLVKREPEILRKMGEYGSLQDDTCVFNRPKTLHAA